MATLIIVPKWITNILQEESMGLLPKKIAEKIPPLYAQEKVEDPIVYVKFFTPWSNWTWYVTEFDGEDEFFGLVHGFEKVLGYFSLSELQSTRGPRGLKIERDLYFPQNVTLSKIRSGEVY